MWAMWPVGLLLQYEVYKGQQYICAYDNHNNFLFLENKFSVALIIFWIMEYVKASYT